MSRQVLAKDLVLLACLDAQIAAAEAKLAQTAPDTPFASLTAGARSVLKLSTQYADLSPVVIAEVDDGAAWHVEISADNVDGFRQHVADILLMCRYSVS